MAITTRLTAVGEEFMPDPVEAQRFDPATGAPAAKPPSGGEGRPPRAESMLASLLLTTLRTLPAKTAIALAGLADLAMIASAFVLWLLVISEPTTLQLIGVGGYAVFVLVALMVRRRAQQ